MQYKKLFRELKKLRQEKKEDEPLHALGISELMPGKHYNL